MSIRDNLAFIEDKIAEAALRSGRGRSEVRLVTVSKTKPVGMIREAFYAGQKIFGENYVQEAVAKMAELPEPEWHLIGSLQTNKVKSIAGRFALIHSVDRAKLALVLGEASRALGLRQDILLQVRVGDEATKAGVSLQEAPSVIEEILAQPSLRLKGLMALPPLSQDEAEARRAFARVKEAIEKWRQEIVRSPDFSELSMGTSADFEWAILEGSTLVRVGTAIFGTRS